MTRTFVLLGAGFSFLAVALGAFGAHLLKSRLAPDQLAIFEVGVRYQMYHSLALFAVAWGVSHFPAADLALAGWLFVAGIVLFSGSLYILGLSGAQWLGAITPVGGLCFLAGWLWIVWKML